jgi:membrane protein implicated in regulation of membrane protease activity
MGCIVLPVPLLLLIILIAAIISGSLWGVLEIAAGVAVGLFLFVALIAGAGYWFFRRKVKQVHAEIERYRSQRHDV